MADCFCLFRNRLAALPDILKSYFLNTDTYCVSTSSNQKKSLSRFLKEMISEGEKINIKSPLSLEQIYTNHYEGSLSLIYDFIAKKKDVEERVSEIFNKNDFCETEEDKKSDKIYAGSELVSDTDSVTLNAISYFANPIKEINPDGSLEKEYKEDKYIVRIVQNLKGYEGEKFLGKLKRKIESIFTKNKEIDVIPTTLGINSFKMKEIDFSKKDVVKDFNQQTSSKLSKRKIPEEKEIDLEYEDTGGHQNLLIFRRNEKYKNTIDVYRFEPHGYETTIDLKSDSIDGKNTDVVLNEFLKANFETPDSEIKIKFSYIPPNEWIPKTHCQGVETDYSKARESDSGFCQIWCSLFLYIMLVYDKLNIHELLSILNESYGWTKEKEDIEKCDRDTSDIAYNLIVGFAFYIKNKMKGEENLEYLDVVSDVNADRLKKMILQRRQLSELVVKDIKLNPEKYKINKFKLPEIRKKEFIKPKLVRTKASLCVGLECDINSINSNIKKNIDFLKSYEKDYTKNYFLDKSEYERVIQKKRKLI